MTDPVCPLILALYGHPDAGGFWEKHCEKALVEVGFEPIPEWKSCFWHPKLRLLLVVYVDDFKLSGPSENLKTGWGFIGSKIKIEPPSPVGRYLGCDQKMYETDVSIPFQPRLEWMAESEPKKPPPTINFGARGEHRMHDNKKLRAKFMKYDMRGFLEQCVERYLELSKTPRTKLRVVETPFIDEGKPECDENETPDASKGTLGDIASAVLMKVLYAGRMGRFDLLRPVNALASKITK
jgi:hypothetical protein